MKSVENAPWADVEIGSFDPFVTSGSRGWGKYYAESGDLFVRISNLSRSSIRPDFSDSRYVVLPKQEREGRRTSVKSGDVLISITADIGISAYIDDGVPMPAYINQHIATVRFPRCEMNGRFVAYYLSSSAPQRMFRSMTDTGAKAGMSLSTVKKIKVPCPELIEQEAISTALNDVDELIATLDALIAKKRDIKQAAMQQLLTGETRLPGFGKIPMVQSELGRIPTDWEVRTLSSLGEPVIGLTYQPTDVCPTGTLVLRSSNVQDGDLVFKDNVFVAPDVGSRALVAEGDILICVRNGSRALIGKCALIDSRAVGMAFGAFMTVFRSPHFDFLHHQFQSTTIQRQIHEHLGATINQITNASLRSFKVPFPKDGAERRAIAGVLSDMDSELRALAEKRFKLRSLREGMMQQLLTGRIRLQ